MLDERVIEKIADHLTAPELVDLLGLSVNEIIDAFEPEVSEKLSVIEDVYCIQGLDTNGSENE